MNYKDLSIYNSIANVAKEIFANSVNVQPGIYSVQEICNMSKKYGCFWADNFDKREIIRVEYDTFSCTFEAGDVFALLNKLGTAWAVPSGYRAKFVRAAETAAPVVSFDVPAVLNKYINAVAAEKDTNAADSMKRVCIDTRRRAVVCCNGHVLAAVPVPNMYVSHDAKETYLIDTVLMKSGKGTLIVDANGNAVNGKNTRPVLAARYPNWHGVCPSVSGDAAVFLGKEFAKVKKAILAAAKFSNGSDVKTVILRAVAGADSLEIIGYRADYYDETTAAETRAVAVSLPQPVPFSFTYAINGVNINAVAAADKMYFVKDETRPVYFVAGNLFVLLMPVCLDKTPWKNETFHAPASTVSEITGVCNFPAVAADNTPAALASVQETAPDVQETAAAVAGENDAVITRNYSFDTPAVSEDEENILPVDEETAAAAFEDAQPVPVSAYRWETEYFEAAAETGPGVPVPVLPAGMDVVLYSNICHYLKIYFDEETALTRAAYNYIILHGVKILFGEIYLHDNKIGSVKKEFENGVCISAVPAFDIWETAQPAAVPEDAQETAANVETPAVFAKVDEYAVNDESGNAVIFETYAPQLGTDEETANVQDETPAADSVPAVSEETAPAVAVSGDAQETPAVAVQDETPAAANPFASVWACMPETPAVDAPDVAQDEETPAVLIGCPADEETPAVDKETAPAVAVQDETPAVLIAFNFARRFRRVWQTAAAVLFLIVCAAVPVAVDAPAVVTPAVLFEDAPAVAVPADSVPAAVQDATETPAVAISVAADSITAAAADSVHQTAKKRARRGRARRAVSFAAVPADSVPAVLFPADSLAVPVAADSLAADSITAPAVAVPAAADSVPAVAVQDATDVPAVAVDEETPAVDEETPQDEETAPAVPADSVPADSVPAANSPAPDVPAVQRVPAVPVAPVAPIVIACFGN